MTRVLVVDDHDDNRYYLRSLLEAHGYQVDEARHGAEALVMARQHPVDLAIADLLMPVMDGFTLLRHWKADARLNSAPVLVYTATYTSPEDERLAKSLGADAFMLKPAEPDALLAVVRELEAKRKGAVPLAQPVNDLHGTMQSYSETLIRKLEQKTLELEETNRSLNRDIAARERIEAELRESQERFQQLAENVNDVFWLSNLAKSTIFYISPAYAVIWGRSCESLYTDPASWLEGVHPDDRDRLVASLPKQVTGEWDETYRVIAPDGALRWVKSRAYPVRDANGQPYRIAGVARDITETRKLEEQFRQAQKMEAIGRLAGGIAHDFNNLLSVILSYSTVMMDDLKVGDPMRADLEEVRHAGERASDLTRQLLSFTRKQNVQPRVLSVGPIVSTMERMLRRLVGEDIKLSLQIGEVGQAMVDPIQIEQILMNLVVNARDAMPNGGALSIEAGNLEQAQPSEAGVPAGTWVLLRVTDSGIGMSAAVQERIFEPFFTTKDKGKGTGLGLSTVYGLVQQLGGRIVVNSELGKGASFSVYLPRSTDQAEAPLLTHATPKSLHGTETILLVEDDDQVRVMTCAILRRHGYLVLDAQNGGEAFLINEQTLGPIHLLLTDVVMPRMSGHELATRLTGTRPAMRVLYMSGYDESPTDPGLTLTKPITPHALLVLVREVLDQRRTN